MQQLLYIRQNNALLELFYTAHIFQRHEIAPQSTQHTLTNPYLCDIKIGSIGTQALTLQLHRVQNLPHTVYGDLRPFRPCQVRSSVGPSIPASASTRFGSTSAASSCDRNSSPHDASRPTSFAARAPSYEQVCWGVSAGV